MFQGSQELSLDAKGRLAVPARHRDALTPGGAPLVITAHPQRCLLVYPEPAWNPIRDQVLAAPSFDPRTALYKRLLVGYAQCETPDAAGRVLISPALRKFAQLGKSVRLVGLGTHFELWSEAGWQEQDAAMLALVGEGLPPGLETLAL
jgi:MraZ protein